MNPIRCLLSTLALAAVCLGTQANADHHEEAEAMTLQSLVTGEHRSADNIARNAWRHPVETLEFFGLEADTTVIEILPSTGWYTEIIAPYVVIRANIMRRTFHRMPRGLYAQDQRPVRGKNLQRPGKLWAHHRQVTESAA